MGTISTTCIIRSLIVLQSIHTIKEDSNMRKSVLRFAGLFASFAMVVSVIGANQSCALLISQPVVPESVKALRKF